MFDNLPEENRNDKIGLLYESSRTNMVAVKTAVGLTKRVNMPDIVQQGGTWGPMLCSNTVDTLGRKCKERNEHCYLYKNTAKILPLAFVDDLNGIAKLKKILFSRNFYGLFSEAYFTNDVFC